MATTKPAAAKPAAKPTAKTEPKKPAADSPEQVEAIFVRSRGKHFHRAGIKFTEHGHGIALDALTEAQEEAIREEPELIVEDCTIDAADVIDDDTE